MICQPTTESTVVDDNGDRVGGGVGCGVGFLPAEQGIFYNFNRRAIPYGFVVFSHVCCGGLLLSSCCASGLMVVLLPEVVPGVTNIRREGY
jgi:hypothetical protein